MTLLVTCSSCVKPNAVLTTWSVSDRCKLDYNISGLRSACHLLQKEPTLLRPSLKRGGSSKFQPVALPQRSADRETAQLCLDALLQGIGGDRQVEALRHA